MRVTTNISGREVITIEQPRRYHSMIDAWMDGFLKSYRGTDKPEPFDEQAARAKAARLWDIAVGEDGAHR